MAPKWSERPKRDRWAIIGAFVGMGIAAYFAVTYAFESETIVRWAIMSAGLIGGGAAGAGAAILSDRR